MGGLLKARELSKAVVDLRDLCLHSSSRWAAEQIRGFPDSQAYLNAQQKGSREGLDCAEFNVEYLLARQIFEGRVRTWLWWLFVLNLWASWTSLFIPIAENGMDVFCISK